MMANRREGGSGERPAAASRPARGPWDRAEGPTDRERRGRSERSELRRPEPTAPNSYAVAVAVADTPASRGVSA
jgi:hypothetical protein